MLNFIQQKAQEMMDKVKDVQDIKNTDEYDISKESEKW